jgi:hypothetical protein
VLRARVPRRGSAAPSNNYSYQSFNLTRIGDTFERETLERGGGAAEYPFFDFSFIGGGGSDDESADEWPAV